MSVILNSTVILWVNLLAAAGAATVWSLALHITLARRAKGWLLFTALIVPLIVYNTFIVFVNLGLISGVMVRGDDLYLQVALPLAVLWGWVGNALPAAVIFAVVHLGNAQTAEVMRELRDG